MHKKSNHEYRKLALNFKTINCNDERIVVIGGGIAGTRCAQELMRLRAKERILLISSQATLLESEKILDVTNRIHEIGVSAKTPHQFQLENPFIEVIIDDVIEFDLISKTLHLRGGQLVAYKQVCICTGATTNIIVDHSKVFGIRDIASLDKLASQIAGSTRMAVVGNGGIAIELVEKLPFCNIDWIMKDNYVGNAFFDATASHFILPSLQVRASNANVDPVRSVSFSDKMMPSCCRDSERDSFTNTSTCPGNTDSVGCTMSAAAAAAAETVTAIEGSKSLTVDATVNTSVGEGVGPDWLHKSVRLERLINENQSSPPGKLQLHFGTEIEEIWDGNSIIYRRGIVCTTRDAVNAAVTKRNASTAACGTKRCHAECNINDEEAWPLQEVLHPPYRGAQAGQDHSDAEPATTSNKAASSLLTIVTSTGERIECDFIVSATGVMPNTAWINRTVTLSAAVAATTVKATATELPIDDDIDNRIVLDTTGGILVDKYMRTSVNDIYAAGDCCTFAAKLHWPSLISDFAMGTSTSSTIARHLADINDNFFQMKLWTQARLMGTFAAQSMCDCAEEYGLDAQFELFTHMTRFFGYKVILLGRFNAQGLGDRLEIMTKQMVITDNGEYRPAAIKNTETRKRSSNVTVTNHHGPLLGDTSACLGIPSNQSGSGITRLQDTILSSVCIPQQQDNKFSIEGSMTYPVNCVSKSLIDATVNDTEIWIRRTADLEYVKLVVHCGKVVGALLIGETDLEETIENLILDRLDVGGIGIQLLDPTVDMTDYFD